MRKLTSHKVNPANDLIDITVMDEPGAGGASHHYAVDVNGTENGIDVRFQNGPINEAGVNGVTQEALIAICIDRLQSFQAGPYACAENALALEHLRAAQFALLSRTKARMQRGVEGTHKV